MANSPPLEKILDTGMCVHSEGVHTVHSDKTSFKSTNPNASSSNQQSRSPVIKLIDQCSSSTTYTRQIASGFQKNKEDCIKSQYFFLK